MTESPRVVIADDSALLAEMLSLACRRRGVTVVGRASSLEGLLRVCLEARPEVAVIADHLGAIPVEACLQALSPSKARLIVLSHDPSPARLGSLFADNVDGYFSYDAGPDEVANGVLAVARGHVALNPAMMSMIVRQWRRMRSQPAHLGLRRRGPLTPREHDVLCAMTDGLAAKAIAVRLGVALKTVENHKIRVFEKLGVRTQAQAVTMAFALGLATAPSGRDHGGREGSHGADT